ncbi:hypothetical protein ABPG74_012724 [Tetrahymena malaccensis]
MIQNSQIDDLKDDDIIKIMKMNEEEFIKEIKQYQLPTCQKEESHSNNPIQFACIENTTEKVVDFNELLIKTYHTVNMQSDKNYFKECIDSTLILLQENFKKLQEVKERINIYCEDVQEKIQTLQKNATFYPSIYVRDIITRIKDSIHINQGEQNSTKANELKILSQQVFFEEKLNMQPVIEGACLDTSMYYLLLFKIKSSTNITSQCLDIGCFILNDIYQCEYIEHYAYRLISNIKCQGNYANNRNNPKSDKQFQEYKKKGIRWVARQLAKLDKDIDFHILYFYELYKFKGFKADNSRYDIIINKKG